MDAANAGFHLNLDQEVSRYRRQAIIAIQIAFLLGAAVLFVQITQSSSKVLASVLASAAMSAASIGLARKGRLQWASGILATQFLVLPTYLAITSLGTFDSAMLILPAGMLAISVVSKPRQMVIFSALTLAAASAVAVATLQGWTGTTVFKPLIDKNPLDVFVTVAVIFFAGIVATYVSFILSSLLRTLAEHQAVLEERVARRTQDLAQSNIELRQAMATLDKARVELVRGEKLAGLGSLVAGVAHELNTPIGNAALTATALQDRVADFSKVMERGELRRSDINGLLQSCVEGTDLIVRATHRARDLVASFKQVAVDQTSDRRRQFLLGDVVDDVVRSMLPSFRGQPWTVGQVVDAEIRCESYPGPLSQVLTNLIQNAVLHGFQGRLAGHVQITAKALGADQIQIVVADDGRGIAADAMNKIFDPFFTTRLGQGGSGLGLTIVHNLVTAILGGSIQAESQVGQGAQFLLVFPCNAPIQANVVGAEPRNI